LERHGRAVCASADEFAANLMPIHSFLELLPLTGVLIVIILQWSQFLSLCGIGAETPRYWIV
jgi:hypothetical protein